MSIDPIKAWLDEAKFWILGFALLAAMGYHFWYGHEQFKAGEATRDKQVAALKADYNTKLAKGLADAKAKYDSQAAAINASATRYKQEKEDAQNDEVRTVADLRSGFLKLRRTWICPTTAAVPQTAAGGPGADAAALDRDESASRIVRAAAEADAQIRALQAVVTADRQ